MSEQVRALSLGGEGGIRTHGGFAPTPDFESGTFDHSATSPVRAIGGTIAGMTALRYTLVKPSILAETAIYLIDT
jgi:hypothetical protein